MLLPALNDLKHRARVTIVGRQPGLDFIRPYVDRAMDMEGSAWHRLFMEAPDAGGLPVSDVDRVVAFLSDSDGIIQRNLTSSLPGARVHLFRSLPHEGADIHVAEYLARCLKLTGLPVDPFRSMEAAGNGILYRKQLLEKDRSKPQRTIILHPGSGSEKKNHPPEFWLEMARRFRQDTVLKGFERIMLLGPAEAHLHGWFMENLATGDAEPLCSFEREHLMEALQRAILCIGHDSGMIHLSALCCIPTVALFKSSNVHQWKPLGPFVHVIETPRPGPALIGEILGLSRAFIGTPHAKGKAVGCS